MGIGAKEQTSNLTVDEGILSAYQGVVPKHIAVIMDGNGRWANARGLPRIRGHRAGADAVRRTVESCRYLGVEVLTLYAFSSQNWGRPEDEVAGLMALFDLYIRKERKRLVENGIALRVIGERGKLSVKLQRAIAELEGACSSGSSMTLQVAVSYGGRDELVRAVRKIAEDVRDGKIEPEEVTAEAVESRLYTHGIADPDLVIRTSSEMRVSNFLLWQIAYSEFHVVEALWPDFDETLLLAALEDFDSRCRRFGRTTEQVQRDQGNSA
jgi:undecaprenyl diphosphate synthase